MNRRTNLPPLAPVAATPRMVRVWDRFVRFFHWSLVYLVGLSYLTGDRWDDLHEMSGYALATLIAARCVWGVVGPHHARFVTFVRGPRAVTGFLRDSLRLKARRYLGHNPAGGAMVVAVLVTLAVICASGVMMGMDAFWGEQWVEDLHTGAVNLCLALVVLHLAGVAVASVEHRENLVRAMVTGRKRAPDPIPRKVVPRRPVRRAAAPDKAGQAARP